MIETSIRRCHHYIGIQPSEFRSVHLRMDGSLRVCQHLCTSDGILADPTNPKAPCKSSCPSLSREVHWGGGDSRRISLTVLGLWDCRRSVLYERKPRRIAYCLGVCRLSINTAQLDFHDSEKTLTSSPSPIKLINILLIDPKSPCHGRKAAAASYVSLINSFARIVLSVTYDTLNNPRITKLMMTLRNRSLRSEPDVELNTANA